MVIVLANQKGGVGKTTLAFNLAFELEAQRVIDLDPQQHLVKFNRYRDMVGLPLMPMAETADKKLLTQTHELYQGETDKWCLIDTGGFDADLSRMAMAIADLVVTPTNDDAVELWSIKSFSEVLKGMKQELGHTIPMMAVFNRLHPKASKPVSALEMFERLDVSAADTVIRQRSAIAQAASQGKTAREHKAAWASRSELEALANEIRKTVNG